MTTGVEDRTGLGVEGTLALSIPVDAEIRVASVTAPLLKIKEGASAGKPPGRVGKQDMNLAGEQADLPCGALGL